MGNMAKETEVVVDPNAKANMLAAIASVDDGGDLEAPAKVEAAPEKPADKPADKPAEKPAATEEKPAAAVVEAKTEPAKPDGVATKDGKNVIPYEFLEQARREASATKQELAEAKAKLGELEQAMASATAGELPEIPDLTELGENFPEALVKPMQAMAAQITALVDANKALVQKDKARDAEIEQDRKDRDTSSYLAARDKFPLLKEIEENPGMAHRYAQAKEISKRMFENKDYKPATHETHFKDVETALRAAVENEAKLFGLAPPPAPAPTPAPEAKPVAAAPTKPLPSLRTPAPASISDIPGGTAPAVNEAEAFLQQDDVSAVAMMGKAMQKSPAHLDAILSRTYR